MDPETHAALHHWKMHRYQYHHIPFADAVRSLSTKKPLIEIKRASRPNEWIACYTGTSNPAVMTYAGVFSEAEPYDTGNLVWGNNEPPPDLEESRITHFAGFKASYSFAIETYHDREIWELQRDVEEYVVTVPGFNIGRVPRLEWQNGHLAMMRFFMRVPMFFPHQTRGPQPRAPDSVHPWVKAAHAKSRTHRANPRPPKVRAIENGVLRPIAECAQKKLEYGDVVGLVFTLGFTETPTSWSPVYMLSDVIRVMRANRDAFPAPTEEQPDETPAYSDDFSITDTPSPSLPVPIAGVVGSAGPVSHPLSPTTLLPAPADTGVEQTRPEGMASPPPAYTHLSSDDRSSAVDREKTYSVAPEHHIRRPDSVEEEGSSSSTETTRGSSSPPASDERLTTAVATTAGTPATPPLSADDAAGERMDPESTSLRVGAKSRKASSPSKPRRG